MLDFRVETFLCVCKYMSYTKAAQELSITQPAVSGHIRYMEDYYKVRLFEYKNKKLNLTPEGILVRHSLETMATDLKHMKEALFQVNRKTTINIGATKSIGDYMLADRLPDFINGHPELNINVYTDDTAALFSLMHEGKIDFFLCEGNVDKAEYNYRFISNESMKAVCAPTHKNQTPEGIQSLFRERLILREAGSGSRNVLEMALLEKGYHIDSFAEICTVNSPALILKLVEQDCGITFIYDSICHDAIKEGFLQEIRIPDFQISHEYNAVWGKDSIFSDKIQEYVEELCEYVRR